jgi:hypothetical protein
MPLEGTLQRLPKVGKDRHEDKGVSPPPESPSVGELPDMIVLL